MSSKFPDIFAALAAPFEPHDVKFRKGAGGGFHYITARTVMNRLDEVVGPESWWDAYVPHEKSVLCRLTIMLPDGRELTKADAGGYAGMSDQGDDDKSGYSDAFKRAAVKFGVARYLYRDGVPNFDGEAATGRRRDRGEDRPPDRRSINEAFASAQETWQSYIGGRLRGMHDGWMREMVAADIETERRQANKEVCKEPEIVVYLCTRLVELGRVTDESVRDPMRARTVVLQAFAKSPASIKRAVDKHLDEILDKARTRLGMPSSGEGEGREPEGVPAGTEEHWPAGRE
jgi:hypothetical protein